MEKIKIGKIVGCHALKGEVKIRSKSDFVDDALIVGQTIYLQYNKQTMPFTIASKRFHKTNYLVAFKDHLDINLVEKYIGCPVFFDKAKVELDKEEYFLDDIIGAQIIYKDNVLGSVIEVIDNGRHDVLVVEYHNKRLMIPYVDAFILEEDIDNNKIVVELLEGMIDED